MRNHWHIDTLGAHGQSLLPWPPPERWNRPTFGEFIERVQHEFGSAIDVAGLMLLGFGRDEPLEPSDIQVLCGQLGVPAEDFGVGP